MPLFNTTSDPFFPFNDGSSQLMTVFLDDPTQSPSNPIPATLGFIVGFVASITQSLGLTMQRKSNILDQTKPKEQRTAGYRRPLWMFGFILFITSNILGSVAQLASLPVIILAPLQAASLIWNAFFARVLLGDMFSPYMALGTFAIVGGAMLIAVFGIIPIPAQSLEDLIRLMKRKAFVIYLSLSCFGLAALLVVAHVTEFTFRNKLLGSAETPLIPSSSALTSFPEEPNDSILSTTERTTLLPQSSPKKTYNSLLVPAPHQPSMPIKRMKQYLAAAYSSASGILGGMSLVTSKAGVELIILTAQGNNQFRGWEPYVLVFGLFASFFIQLWYQNKSLVFGDPIFVAPLSFCFTNLSAILNVLVYYDQFSTLSALQLGMIFLGLCILLSGVLAVSITPEDAKVQLETRQLPVAEESSTSSRQ